MNYNDHNPSHFHARHQDEEVTVEIETGLVTGVMFRRALQIVFEWLDLHKDELRRNWQLARERKPLEEIPPLA